MATLKAVIGANYGDEGKGHIVDYLTYMAAKPCIVVCTNGGAQRGHTVCTQEHGQHIFHHFGSGTFAGADTYLPKQFIMNPMIFAQEYQELRWQNFTVYADPNCLVSTPYDMIVNQIIEERRGTKKHGSCGVGIWETILRNEATIGELYLKNNDELYDYLKGVRDTYFMTRLKSKGIEVPKRWADVYFSYNLIMHYIQDFRFMMEHIKLTDASFLKTYRSVIFENGQGLMLDQNIQDSAHSTPSNTGSKDIRNMVKEVFDDAVPVEVCYVTRTYATRHGAGELNNEVGADYFMLNSSTETNVWNKNQGVFRYGRLDIEDLDARCTNDFNTYWDGYNLAVMSYAITHLDERIFKTAELVKDKKFYSSVGPNRHNILEAIYSSPWR